jgi:glucokinase
MFVGLDIGGTKTAVLVVNRDLVIKSRYQSKTDTSSADKLVEGIVESIHCALKLAGSTPDQLIAIGAGFPGHVIPETGEVKNAINLNLVSFPFGKVLSSAFGVPVMMENDVRTAALGSFEGQPSQGKIDQLAYLSIGTGISAGLVLNGRLYRGYSGMAGEIGHVVFEPEGRLCRCGARGCLEAVASGPAIAQQWQEAKHMDPGLMVTAKDVYAAADRGEPMAVSVIQQVSKFLARAVQLLIMLYDVEKLVIGGGVSRAGSSFLEPIFSALSHIRTESNLAQEMLLQEKVTLLPPGSDAPAWGAVKLALQAF